MKLGLPPSSVVAAAELEADVTDVLSWTAESLGLGVCMVVPSPRGWVIGFLAWNTTRNCALSHQLWHISYLKFLAVLLALWQFRQFLLWKHVLVCMDNNATVSYINWHSCLWSRCMLQLAHHLLLWNQMQLESLHAAQFPCGRRPLTTAYFPWTMAT